MKCYQIIRKPIRGGKWEFVAHGAIYTDDEGDDIERLIARNGLKTRRLAV